MPKQTLFAYVDGQLPDASTRDLEATLQTYVDGRQWVVRNVCVVNDPVDPVQQEDQQTGINLELPEVGSEPSGWFADVEEIASFLSELAAERGLEFVIGIADPTTGIAEDLFWVNGHDPDLRALRAIIGVAE